MIEWVVAATLFCSIVSIVLGILVYKTVAKSDSATPWAGGFAALERASERLDRSLRDELGRNREEASVSARDNRVEVVAVLRESNAQLEKSREAFEQRLHSIQEANDKKLEQVRQDSLASAKQVRDDLAAALKNVNEVMLKGVKDMSDGQRAQMESLSAQFTGLTESNRLSFEALKASVEQKLQTIQADNAKQLEQMRQTVDEKLQGTLEKRLGESFKQVSEQLESVYKGVGEMRELATGVGDLKKVLNNVKTRGTWAEVQLGVLLEQALHGDQYQRNFSCKDTSERVEFAIRLPGQGEDPVWLPIDAKFPQEDYIRLQDAQEKGDLAAAEEAANQLEERVRSCAKDIHDKYLNPPRTTDFAILYLPTEGLFAEVIRRAALIECLQQKFRVMIAGPTTLWALLTSLQMGFRTLAIQKRSSEIWKTLANVKAEWEKYENILDKVQKKLEEATSSIGEAQKRTRVIGKKLRDVEELPSPEGPVLQFEND